LAKSQTDSAGRFEILTDAAAGEYELISEAWSMRAFIRISTRDIAGATAGALRAVELDSANAGDFLALASAYNSSQMFAEAETALRHALELRPDFWQARLELAKTWYDENRFVLALRQLDLIERDFPDVHLVRANILVSLGRKREGAAEFRTLLQEAPADRRDRFSRLWPNSTGLMQIRIRNNLQ